MVEQIFHSIDASHIRNIGEQSVSNKIQAILEIVKNAYDADALECIVTFHGLKENKKICITSITIEDDGIGMTRDDLKNKFMKVGTNSKLIESVSHKLKRRVSGEKGMGHYSIQRLGNKITITTTPEPLSKRLLTKKDNTTHVLELDWTKYVEGKDFEKIPNNLSTTKQENFGTRIDISDLRDNWSTKGKNNDLSILAKNLGSIMLPKELQSDEKDEFKAYIKTPKFDIKLPEIKAQLLDYAPYRIQARLSDKHIAYRIFQRKKNKITQIDDGLIPSNNTKCGNAEIVIYWFPDKSSTWTTGVFNPGNLRDQLKDNYGIKIYNDKIRVMPYGEIDNDWLGLGSRKSGAASGGKVRNVHLVGFLRLSRKNNPEIIETTTRQALRENFAFTSLKEDFVMRVIRKLEYEVQIIKKAKEELERKTHPSNIAQIEIKRIEDTIQNLDISKEYRHNIGIGLTKVSKQIVIQLKKSNEVEEKLVANLEMYRNLSTVGIQTLAFNHEIIDPIRFVKGSLKNLIQFDNTIDPVKRVDSLEKCLKRITTSLNWANHIKEFSSLLAGSSSSKKKHDNIRIDDTLREIREGMSAILDALHITVHDPIIIGDIPNMVMNKASFESIFINLISNSVRSLKQVNRNRNITIKVLKDGHNIIFEFEDNGYGIDEDNKDEVFKAFFTTYKNLDDKGTGMGLTIIKEIVEDDYDGQVILKETIYEKKYPKKGMAKFLVRLPIGKVVNNES